MILELRHRLHENAELSGNEVQTKKILMNFLREHTGLSVTDRGTWFYAAAVPSESDMRPAAQTRPCKDSDTDRCAAKGPIAFRADMDALPIPETIDLPYASCNPGVSHKCGHDGHSAALAGLALEADRLLRESKLSRPVYLIFQHAEEIGAGGAVCAELLEEKKICEVYAFHNLGGFPENAIVYRRNQTQPESEGLTITFRGRPSHASAPENGINPARAIAKMIDYAGKLAEIRGGDRIDEPTEDRSCMALCTIVHVRVGKRDFGVSAGDAEISVTLRSDREAVMKQMEAGLLEYAEKVADSEHLKVSHSIADYFPETRNEDGCLNRVLAAAAKTGRQVIAMPEIWRASEDFGYYTRKTPGAMFYIGTGVDHAPLYTTAYDFDDAILETAVDMFKELI